MDAHPRTFSSPIPTRASLINTTGAWRTMLPVTRETVLQFPGGVGNIRGDGPLDAREPPIHFGRRDSTVMKFATIWDVNDAKALRSPSSCSRHSASPGLSEKAASENNGSLTVGWDCCGCCGGAKGKGARLHAALAWPNTHRRTVLSSFCFFRR